MIENINSARTPPVVDIALVSGDAVTQGALTPGLCDNSCLFTGKTHMDNPEDQALNGLLSRLLTRIAAREEVALAELYDATAHKLYAVALRIGGAREAADEIVSDVYYQVWNQADRYDPARGRVLAWMMIVCRSRALDHRRRRDTAEAHPDPTLLLPDLAAADDNDPLDLLLIMERDSAVSRALAGLDARERSLLSMAFFAGLTHQEIADTTGMPLGSVKSILRRSMQTLRPLLEQLNVGVKESS